ncbi:MAG: hypothetical protein KTR33_01270, partial [Gammaproteobacteria bacterium]|nr:hypothetical protein [Gammaproteobacteria bacterium]
SKHTRQTLYVDLWTGQHWLGLRLSCGEIPACQNNHSPPPTARERELLAPVSSDTALSIASSPFGLQ